ncbi:hypothetical protein DYD83_04675 [Dickeya fangzhongdai]|uniref:Uncharacterized protein n=1 Tax=Dickeya fangzhongdai TaxID=1778540 RepID=A0A2K8QIM9_9GAMM|nr:hypothetical protein CVE23_04635 [Dickeya fangzhongdai]QOH46753.1 hypothetical protein DYD82_04675 [Dickeya fangzhongdai]QOH51058.1 hypothetical protein DYD83_04675 [Dickeya fangzhongdai]
MWPSSNFLLLTHCFSRSGLVFNRTIILMREINIRRGPHIRISFQRHGAARPDASSIAGSTTRGHVDVNQG